MVRPRADARYDRSMPMHPHRTRAAAPKNKPASTRALTDLFEHRITFNQTLGLAGDVGALARARIRFACGPNWSATTSTAACTAA